MFSSGNTKERIRFRREVCAGNYLVMVEVKCSSWDMFIGSGGTGSSNHPDPHGKP